MKKRLLLTAVLLTLICLLFTACQNICPHIYDADGVCKICNADAPTYTVTFNSAGGSEVPSQTVKHGSKVDRPENPTRESYTFVGWYHGDSRWSFDKDTVKNNITLTAKWRWTAAKYSYDTTLIYQLTDNSNSGELPSTCGRYLAGNLEGVTDISTIDQWVIDRNNMALREYNVNVEYQYLPDTSQYNWGMNIDTIDAEVHSKNPKRPDIYCNFIYDMVSASLKGSFANLLSTTMYEEGHKLYGVNHFDFKGGLDRANDDEGYMIEYMRSLTLSKDKVYCLASDYYVDMVRAFLVVPVNIKLLETLTASGSYDQDLGKGDFLADRVTTYATNGTVKVNYTIEDFYQLVYDMEWNYETLAKFSDAIFKEGEDGDENVNLGDTVGFALGTSSEAGAVGMLYTTSIPTINRAYDVEKGEYCYSYPNVIQSDSGEEVSFVNGAGTYSDLIMFCNNLSALFSSNGVITVSSDDTHGYGETDLTAIRARFADGKILFGGIVTLGSLEYNEYYKMHEIPKASNVKRKTGYGIAPVPLYRTNYVDASTGEVVTDKYLTQVHSIGKIGAISYTTEKFAACTAYLNYQCTNSTITINEYYDYKFQYDVVGTDIKGNVNILKYIRYNVRSGFDKTFEDALGKYYLNEDAEAINQKWHVIIMNENFKVSDMEACYELLAPIKAQRLYDLENTVYPTLPD